MTNGKVQMTKVKVQAQKKSTKQIMTKSINTKELKKDLICYYEVHFPLKYVFSWHILLFAYSLFKVLVLIILFDRKT